MSRPHGRARVNPSAPRAFAACDRCGFLVNHADLRWAHDWVGPRLQNKRFLVCDRCLDVPQEQSRTIILPPDPLPIQNPRPNYGDANQYPDHFHGSLAADTGLFLVDPESDLSLGMKPVYKGATLQAGSYVISGLATLTKIGRGDLDVDYWNFLINGNSAKLAKSYKLPDTTGSFAFAGEDATLAFKPPAAFAQTGVFTLSGQPATLGPGLAAVTKTFTFTGQTAGVKIGYKLPEATKAFVLTGQAASVNISTRNLTANTGGFSLALRSATLKVGLPAATYSFTFAGQVAALTKVLIADYHSYTYLTDELGEQLTDELGNLLVDETGQRDTFSFSGYSATLVRSGRNLSASTGGFNFGGLTTTLNANSTLLSLRTFTPVEIPEFIHQRRIMIAALIGKPELAAETKTFSSIGMDSSLVKNAEKQVRRSPAQNINPNTYWEPPKEIKLP